MVRLPAGAARAVKSEANVIIRKAASHIKKTTVAKRALPSTATAGRKARRAFGSGKEKHTARVTVTRNGQVVERQVLRSGNMTAAEKALGFPRSTLATHTENRATRQIPLEAGDHMLIRGQYSPCNSCKGAMNRAVREKGVSITYSWGNQIWKAGKKR